jgi:hypothetical protein
MSAGTQNLDMSALFRAERGKRPALSQTCVPKKEKQERLRIVRDDDRESILDELSNCGEKASKKAHLHADDLSEGHIVKPFDKKQPEIPDEPGVDLSILQPRDMDTAKMASYVQNISAILKDRRNSTAPESPQKEISMPLANTDLQDIFQKDSVCMVSRRHDGTSAGANDIEHEIASSQTAFTPVPAPKIAPTFDKTLKYLSDNWSQLPANVQAAILNVVDAAVAPDDD